MITEKFTEEFFEEHYFVLEEDYELEEWDEYCYPTGEFMTIKKGTEWEQNDKDFISGDIHLDGLSTGQWIEISEETFREIFSAHKWRRKE